MRKLYRTIISELDNPTHFHHSYEYSNPYEQMEFRVTTSHYFKEYVFVCPFRNSGSSSNRAIIPYYVSKEYDVGPFGEPYMPGRFIFGNLVPKHPNSLFYMILAEEPASTFTDTNFNVELYYLQIRKYIQLSTVYTNMVLLISAIFCKQVLLLYYSLLSTGESNDIDPFCKLISGEVLDPNNQHYRFCVAISRSAHFKNKIKYPERAPTFPCNGVEVSFRTADGKSKATGRLYYERMTLCLSKYEDFSDGDFVHLYISRAYRSNQLFVYFRDPLDGHVYLENLSTNLSIIDEFNSFDFVED